jgi:hypothetical protein
MRMIPHRATGLPASIHRAELVSHCCKHRQRLQPTRPFEFKVGFYLQIYSLCISPAQVSMSSGNEIDRYILSKLPLATPCFYVRLSTWLLAFESIRGCSDPSDTPQQTVSAFIQGLTDLQRVQWRCAAVSVLQPHAPHTHFEVSPPRPKASSGMGECSRVLLDDHRLNPDGSP